MSEPLNTAKVLSDPCSVLTSADVDALKLTGAQTRVANAGGPGCEWYTPSVSDSVNWPEVTAGLQDAYTAHAENTVGGDYWQPTTVDGYPAVWDEEPDSRQSGDCSISVGVNSQRYFLVLYQMSAASNSQANATQSCDAAKQTASAVLKNLKAGS